MPLPVRWCGSSTARCPANAACAEEPIWSGFIVVGRLDELLDKTLEITKRTRGEYSNVYFNRRLNIAAAPSGGVADEDLPF